jgi:AraC family transcriptional regulator of adaptative response/methylated-DNA-[protein]-cysteine methyltransferase
MIATVKTSASPVLHYAIGQCSLGRILVARSERGVCAIFLDDDPEALTRELADRFPQATLVRRDDELAQSVAEVTGLVETPRKPLELLLDLRGTVFQQRVWQALREIPAGTTTTYAEVARRIGAPKSVRAVAHACATNPVALVVPCHRVLRRDGALAGYRWGLDRKRILLEREAEE